MEMSCVTASYSQLYRRCLCCNDFGCWVVGGCGGVDPAWGVNGGGGFSTICSPPAHWRRREGDSLSSYLISLSHNTQTQITEVCLHIYLSTPTPFPPSFWRLNRAWPERWLQTWAVLNKPNTCFLSGCTCSVGTQGSAVCLPCHCCCCCCVDWAIPH